MNSGLKLANDCNIELEILSRIAADPHYWSHLATSSLLQHWTRPNTLMQKIGPCSGLIVDFIFRLALMITFVQRRARSIDLRGIRGIFEKFCLGGTRLVYEFSMTQCKKSGFCLYLTKLRLYLVKLS